MKKQRLIVAAAVLMATLMSGVSSQERSAPAPSTKEQLEQIRKDARADVQGAAKALRAMPTTSMNDEDRANWVHLAREAAVRTGDGAWLVSLQAQDDPFALMPLAQLLLANGYLNEGRFAAAKDALAQITNLQRINTRDQRRYWALKVRLAQLTGNVDEERAAIERILHELGHWPSADCQSCHGDLKNPKQVPLLDVQAFWFGQRYVALLKQRGDADAVRLAAERKLAADPKDDDARVFLILALLALDKPDDAQQRVKEIAWAAPNGSKVAPPRMIFMWP